MTSSGLFSRMFPHHFSLPYRSHHRTKRSPLPSSPLPSSPLPSSPLPSSPLTVLCVILIFHVTLVPAHEVFTRLRRDTTLVARPGPDFVVPTHKSGELFTISSGDRDERFYWIGFPPEGFELDEQSGVVSTGAVELASHVGQRFTGVVAINSTTTGELIVEYTVHMHIVERESYRPRLFTNEPSPLKLMLGEWNRPDTHIYTLESVDERDYNANVLYRLEAGGDGRFALGDAGELYTTGRLPLVASEEYRLAFSARVFGDISDIRSTPTQVLTIFINYTAPQFYNYDRGFIVESVNEDDTANAAQSVFRVRAKSFFDFTVQYSMTLTTPGGDNPFRMNDMGDVFPQRRLYHANRSDKKQYRYIVTAIDRPNTLMSNAELIINLEPVNEHRPTFPAMVYVSEPLNENVSNGTDVLSLSIIDIDAGTFGDIEFEIVDNNVPFRIVKTGRQTAQIKTNGFLEADDITKPLRDRELYSFEVKATDNVWADGGDPDRQRYSTITNVRVWVTNIDDEPPSFIPSEQSIRIKERLEVDGGTELLVGILQAYDPDSEQITFTFQGGRQTVGKFRLSPQGGVYLTANMDELTQEERLIRVDAVDGAGNRAEPPLRLDIDTIGVNRPPYFDQCNGLDARLPENSPEGTSIVFIRALDDDTGSNGELRYQLVDVKFSNPKYFRIGSSDVGGIELLSNMVFDRERPELGSERVQQQLSYPITVQVEDGANVTSTCFLLVTIEDENDNSPIFALDDGNVQKIPYNLDSDTRLYQMYAYDLDEGRNAAITYSIDNNDIFRIDEKGWIWTQEAITDTWTSINLVVTASDSGVEPLSTSITMTFNRIRDLQPPQWQNIRSLDGDYVSIYDFTLRINEEERGESLQEFYATGTDDINYSIIAGGREQENSLATFVFVPSGNEDGTMRIQYKNTNFETISEYKINLQASYLVVDENLQSLIRIPVEVSDINYSAPQFIGFNSFGVYIGHTSTEFPAGTSVTSVFAIDRDGTAPNNEVRYIFSSECDPCIYFTIGDESGEIKTGSNWHLIEDIDEVQLTIIAYDLAEGDMSKSSTTNVPIRITGPYQEGMEFDDDNLIAEYNIPEAPREFATIVASIEAETTSAQTVPQYSIVSGNERHQFIVSGHTIQVVGDLLFSEQQEYNLEYRVFDGSTEDTFDVTVRVMQQDIFRPEFSSKIYLSREVTEGSNADTTLVTVSTEPQSTYSLVGPLYNDNRDKFTITPNGQVTLVGPLDADLPDGHEAWLLNVAATTNGSPASSTTIDENAAYAMINIPVRNVNDNAPEIDTCCLIGYVDENISGAEVLQIIATDADNNLLTYRLDPDDVFRIDNNGMITTRDTQLDREGTAMYVIDVIVGDLNSDGSSGPESATAEVTIFVTDVNDNAPEFPQSTYSFVVPEALPIGSSVGEVRADDLDVDANLIYGITGSNTQYFYIDSVGPTQTGVIKLQQEIDYDVMGVSKVISGVMVTATERRPNGQDFRTTCRVDFTITNVNDNVPVFMPAYKAVALPENVAPGTEVDTFEATDADDESVVQINHRYYIDYINSDPERNFAIGRLTGVVKVENPLDWETTTEYSVRILAVDSGEPPMTGTATLNITVSDINDNAPQFDRVYNPVVLHTMRPQQLLIDGALGVIDKDQNPRTISVSPRCQEAQPSDACDYFEFEFTGTDFEIRASQTTYDRETLGVNYFTIPVLMSDGEQSDTSTVTITVESRNVNPHKAAEKDVTVYNYKGLFHNVYLGHVYALDDDDWDRTEKTYEWVGSHEGFSLGDGEDAGRMYMMMGTPEATHRLQVRVKDDQANIVTNINVKVVYIDDDLVRNSASIRLSGLTAKQFIEPGSTQDSGASPAPSKLSLLQTELAKLLDTQADYVDIFTVRDVPNTGPPHTRSHQVDVRYVAHGSPHYQAVRMNGLVYANIEDIESSVGVDVWMSPVDECLNEDCFDSGCTNDLIITDEPLTINTNQSSLVGVTAFIEARCECASEVIDSPIMEPASCQNHHCLNNGTCVETYNDYKCVCPDGFEGPHCQQLKHSFGGDADSWAWYPPLQQCDDSYTSFEFITNSQSGLLLYNGPMYAPQDQGDPRDFMSVALVNNNLEVKMELGAGVKTLNVDGGSLSNGEWHSVEIYKTRETIRVVVDHCTSARVTETPASTSIVRTGCEAVDTSLVNDDYVLLNVNAPLQLGGRSDDSNYPSGVSRQGFTGCIKNFWHNGLLYDLHIGEIGESSTSTGRSVSKGDGCPSEVGCDLCAANSTCVGSLQAGSQPQCVCYPGLRGENCDIDILQKDFEESDSYMEWQLNDRYLESVEATPAFQFVSIIQVMFITRLHDAYLWAAYNYNEMELLRIQLVDGLPQFAYDLGSGIRVVQLPYANASDGQWHTLQVKRYGNQITLRMDDREGRYIAYTPFDSQDHSLITLEGKRIVAAANVDYRYWDLLHEPNGYSEVLEDSCMSDIRFKSMEFPMKLSENGISNVELVADEKTLDECLSTACLGNVCIEPAVCADVFRTAICVCPAMYEPHPISTCTLIMDCSYDPCVHGQCVMLADGNRRCNCNSNWTGEVCDIGVAGPAPRVVDEAGVSTVAIIIIILCILLVIVLILLFFVWRRRQQQKDLLIKVSEPEDYVGENIMFYDDEGAGEEDQDGYDISRLQKPIGSDNEPYEMKPIYPEDSQPLRTDVGPPLGTSPHEPFGKSPDKYPNVDDFIGDRLDDADDDPNAPPYDSVREYQYEGEGSDADDLSSLSGSSSSGDQDYDYLNNYGPKFDRLADIYGRDNEEDSDDNPYENQSEV